jgi:hypothetical protein
MERKQSAYDKVTDFIRALDARRIVRELWEYFGQIPTGISRTTYVMISISLICYHFSWIFYKQIQAAATGAKESDVKDRAVEDLKQVMMSEALKSSEELKSLGRKLRDQTWIFVGFGVVVVGLVALGK